VIKAALAYREIRVEHSIEMRRYQEPIQERIAQINQQFQNWHEN
jgi:hypothetical protein